MTENASIKVGPPSGSGGKSGDDSPPPHAPLRGPREIADESPFAADGGGVPLVWEHALVANEVHERLRKIFGRRRGGVVADVVFGIVFPGEFPTVGGPEGVGKSG